MHTFKLVAKWVLALLFVAAGVNHFVNPGFYVKIMPPYLPWHYELVLVSGAFEVLGGIGLLVPGLTRAAAWGLIALLVAVFPANLHMALHPEAFPNVPPAVAWAFWFTRQPPAGAPGAPP
ncbi:MAG TPA: DoxX family membrane protein [Gemmata sp.]